MSKEGHSGKIAIVIGVIVFLGFLLAAQPAWITGYATVTQCNDGKDNDLDGYIDFPNDPGCASSSDSTERNLQVQCDDGKDNDGDGKKDLLDKGCVGPTDNDETNCGDNKCEGGEVKLTCPIDCGINSCGDSDGGNSPNVLGTVQGRLKSVQYVNSDYCSTANILVEYFCNGDYKASQSVTCPNGCNEGKCNSAPANSCSDTDGGEYTQLKGTIAGYNGGVPFSSTDFCQDLQSVTEYSCSGFLASGRQINCGVDSYSNPYCLNYSIYKTYYDYYCSSGACMVSTSQQFLESCSYGCMNGICNPAPASFCYDSDNGANSMVYGFVAGSQGGLNYSYYDSCLNGSAVSENYCVGTDRGFSLIPCPAGGFSGYSCIGTYRYMDYSSYACSSGACSASVNQVFDSYCANGCLNGSCVYNPAAKTCEDFDGSLNATTVAARVQGNDGLNMYNFSDVCTNNLTLREFGCIGVEPTNNVLLCNGGSYSANYCYLNNVYRDHSYYSGCYGGSCLVSNTRELVQICPNGCSNGACITTACTDSDGGVNTYVKGTTTDGVTTGIDSCYNFSSGKLVPSCPGNGACFVNEYQCSLDVPSRVADWHYICSNGCSNGACLSAPANSCVDTDGGVVKHVKGTTYGYISGTFYALNDSCTGSTTLSERYCSGVYATTSPLNCTRNGTTVCSGGRCI